MIRVLSLGAGVQSSTLALMSACGEVPMLDAAIFADTQAEPPSVYRWLDYLEQQLPFPIHRVTAGDLVADVLKPRITKDGRRYCRTNLPFYTVDNNTGERGMVNMRSCTKDFKIRPIEKKLRDLIGRDVVRKWWIDRRKNQDTSPLMVQWIGISFDEVRRMKPARPPFIQTEWPLIDLRMTRRKCIDWMQSHGHPKPPRSACIFCPFHSNEEWRRLRDEEAVQFEKAVQFERAASVNFVSTPYLHKSCKPLDQVDLRTDEERGQYQLWNNECEGMCGV